MRDCFETALAMPADARSAFLTAHCSGPAMVRKVERMLAASVAEERRLFGRSVDVVAAELAAAAVAMEPAQWIGRTIGGARLLDVVGQGGSAVVFRAEKRTADVLQVVAVKLFRQVLLTEVDVRRFKCERAAMARLTHPQIARLIDGGIADGGLPYLVLEYVDGRRITHHADDACLDQRARVRLMVDVCRAVEAAHRALIVHRDLKPSNVLVSSDGHVKLLDFGIAKFLTGEDETTLAGQGALTPAYAAPEQFEGDAVTTATDVYALGVLLGELLTGRRPSTEAARAPSATVRHDAHSGAAEDPHVPPDRPLRGDLRTIVQMAMASDPARRYASAGALADDLDCFLDARPVRAHPPSRRYRLARFYRRHRYAVTIAAGLGVLLVAAVIVAVSQARSAAAQARRADAAAGVATSTRDFLVDLFRQAEPAGARAAPATVIDVTRGALSRLEADTRLDPRVRLDLTIQLGSVLRGQSALRASIGALRDAAERGARAFGAADPLVLRANRELGAALVAAGDYDAADALVRAASALSFDDADARVRFDLLAATVASRRGDALQADRHLDAAGAQCAAGCSDRLQLELLNTQGEVHGTFDRNTLALAAFEKAAALTESRFGAVHVEHAAALDGLGRAYRRMGRSDDARRVAQAVLDIDDRIGVPAYDWRRAMHLHRLANAYHDLGQFEPALALYEQAIAISNAISDDDESVAVDIRNVAIVYYKLGRFEPAIRHLNDALARQVAAGGAHHRSAADTRANLAEILARSGDTRAAVPMIRQAVDDLASAGEGAERQLAEAWLHQGSILLLAGDAPRALPSIERAVAQFAALGADLPEALPLYARVLRGIALARLGRTAEARAEWSPALQRLGALDVQHHVQADGRFAFGLVELDEGRCGAARAHLAAGRQLLARKPFVQAALRAAESRLASALATRCDR
ncbi:MAG TPA: serine/threonine-protein kinase [Tahibacter sp.]|uniref:serine/threonine-protein kinase n=1 Tax=Tahibacter sp. TaxID=2056211 RepID=UPI002CDA16A7|nr:serine/threonine-protein kinase [Tahibacter sp.]HSX62143.1 serine/threonine-protein kinase [Tahibacter sp.]